MTGLVTMDGSEARRGRSRKCYGLSHQMCLVCLPKFCRKLRPVCGTDAGLQHRREPCYSRK